MFPSKTMKETKTCTPEYLSKDILDKDFVRTFTVFYRLQYILGSCRIEVKDQFVASPTRYQKCYTMFCIFMTVILNILLISQYLVFTQDLTIYYLSAAGIWAGFVNFLCVIINARFSNGQGNADFFIKMQKLDRLMGLDKIKSINLILKNINNTSLILLLGAFFVLFVGSCTSMSFLYMTLTGAIYCQFTCILELVYCSNLVIYFVIRLRFNNCILKNHLKQEKVVVKPNTYWLFSYRNLKKLALETHNFTTSDTYMYLKEIFELFSMFQNLYRFQLFIFCLKLVFGSVCIFGLILFSFQRNVADKAETLAMFVFNVIDFLIAIFLGGRLQFLFGEVKETKRLSIAVMAVHPSGQLRDKARNMLKMAEETPPRLSIYDMYDMDAGIFLTVFSLITSLIVTLLQFALL